MSAPVAIGLQFSICAKKNWSERGDLNSRPPVPQTGALTELRYAPKPIIRAGLDIHGQAVETSHHRPGEVYSLARVSTRLQAASSSISTLERFRIELRRSRAGLAARNVPPALRGLGGDVGNRVRRHRVVLLVVGDASVIHHETRPVLAEDLLHTPDGVAIVVEQEADAAQKLHVLRPVITPAAAALHGFQLGEFGFPEAQHVLRDFKLVSNLADRAKRLWRLIQRPSSLLASNRRRLIRLPFFATAHR